MSDLQDYETAVLADVSLARDVVEDLVITLEQIDVFREEHKSALEALSVINALAMQLKRKTSEKLIL